MSWLSRLFGVEKKESAVGNIIAQVGLGRPVWTPRNYSRLAEESYVRNAIAYSATKMIASSAAAVPIMLKNANGETIESSPLWNLLDTPNQMQSRQEFLEAVFSSIVLAGNVYIERAMPQRTQQPHELWVLNPDRVTVIPSRTGIPSAYRYEYQGRQRDFESDPVTGDSNILHIRDFHPTNDWYGLSRVEPAAYSIDIHNSIGAHTKALLDNGTRPSGAMIMEPVKGRDGDEQSPPQDLIENVYKALTDRHGGPNNAGKPLVLSGHVKWLEMGKSPKDMDFENARLQAAREICTAFGVPHVLLIPGQSTYNNVAEAKLQFYEETITPLVGKLFDGLNSWLVPKFEQGAYIEPDWDSVSALEPRRQSRRQSAIDLWERNLLTQDEAREMIGREPWPEEAKRKFNADEVKSIITAAMQRLISDDAAVEELLRRGVLSDSYNRALDQDLIEESDGPNG